MAKAMRMSLQDLSNSEMDIDSQQDTAVFRPATGNMYNADQWGIVQQGVNLSRPPELQNFRREPNTYVLLYPLSIQLGCLLSPNVSIGSQYCYLVTALIS